MMQPLQRYMLSESFVVPLLFHCPVSSTRRDDQLNSDSPRAPRWNFIQGNPYKRNRFLIIIFPMLCGFMSVHQITSIRQTRLMAELIECMRRPGEDTWIFPWEPDTLKFSCCHWLNHNALLYSMTYIKTVVADPFCILWAKRWVLIADFGMLSIPQNTSVTHIRDITVCPRDGYFNRPLSLGIMEAILLLLTTGLIVFQTHPLYKSLTYVTNAVCLIGRHWGLPFNLLTPIYERIYTVE